MALSRRDFLKLGGLAATASAVSSCSVIGSQIASQDLPDVLLPPEDRVGDGATTQVVDALPTLAVNPVLRLLNRGGYGPRPGDLQRANEMGLQAYLEEQLNPEAIDDTAADLIVQSYSYYDMDIDQIIASDEPTEAVADLIRTTVARQLYSKRQLYEAMVEFWSDHFNIYLRKNPLVSFTKIEDDRAVIRPHALGSFRDLLYASAQSPAMLIYLDNITNEKDHPNENYARELMELHTMGVHGGYTQEDVQQVARALTGWTLRGRGPRRGDFFFDENLHDQGEKVVLGVTLPAGQGQQDVFDVLDILLAHPATAQHIATKLVRRFVADQPPETLVEQVAQTFTATDGDIKEMLRVIFLSDEFATAPAKLKRPHTYMISALRALNAEVTPEERGLGRFMNLLGQPIFQWPAPNGYPDVSAAWVNNLLPRWNFGIAAIYQRIPGVNIDLLQLAELSNASTTNDILNLFAGLTINRVLDDESLSLFASYVGDGALNQSATRIRLGESVALMLASPAFQWT